MKMIAVVMLNRTDEKIPAYLRLNGQLRRSASGTKRNCYSSNCTVEIEKEYIRENIKDSCSVELRLSFLI